MDNRLEYRTFSAIAEALKKYNTMLSKVEYSLGGVILEDFWQVVDPIYSELERLSGAVWTDELWEILFDDSKSVEEAWKAIQQLQEEEING